MLDNSDGTNSIEMVFVNACNSEGIGKVFSEARIPIVIVVQSSLKILDKVATEFSAKFYKYLLF